MWPFTRPVPKPDPTVALVGLLTELVKSQQQQTAMLTSFFDAYKTAEPPQLRQFDEAADTDRYLREQQARRAAETLPPGLAGLAQLDQFQALLDRMEAD